MIAEKNAWPKPHAKGESVASGDRLPTPPAPPSGSAVTGMLPPLPPSPARAEQEQAKNDDIMVDSDAGAAQLEAPQEQSSPTNIPSEEETAP
eukprot:2608781-Pyramimonas_sp.AAC.1